MIVHGTRSAHAQRRVANAFRQAGALAPDHAKPLAQLGLTEDRCVRALVDQRIIREVRAGEFYLDDDAYRQRRAMVMRWMIVPLAIVLALMIYGLVAGTR